MTRLVSTKGMSIPMGRRGGTALARTAPAKEKEGWSARDSNADPCRAKEKDAFDCLGSAVTPARKV